MAWGLADWETTARAAARSASISRAAFGGPPDGLDDAIGRNLIEYHAVGRRRTRIDVHDRPDFGSWIVLKACDVCLSTTIEPGDDHAERLFVSLEVGNQDFDLAGRDHLPDPEDGIGIDRGPSVRKLVAVHAGDDHVLEFHRGDGLSDPVESVLGTDPALADSDEPPLFVATNGVDAGSCQDSIAPCRRLYASRALRAAWGRYLASR